ncbi:hypothetical protein MSAN_01661600 [Mycena sanguinolenta]|uniref:F-box domain-containing protein n=1 Tax=Mycena sanguinolenta TaxID=230812 RepID=A0A8H7CUJ6_9AGAR|nr:hypothetical protein MSAN_01661600 [Mycena sanguinolenta]
MLVPSLCTLHLDLSRAARSTFAHAPRVYGRPMKFAAFFRQDLPLDLLRPILEELTDRRDLCSCVLVNRNFNRAAIPLLYSVLDSRVVSKSKKTVVAHPSTTLIKRPELAQYVHHVTETGAVHRGLAPQYSNITEDTLHALSLCINLRSMTWIDDFKRFSGSDKVFLAFISAIRNHPLRSLTIRTHSDLGEEAWAQLTTLTGLRKVSIWCLEGPPYLLGNGWASRLRSTLTHLELGRCAGVPNTLLLSVLSQLPLLQDIRLKGAPSNAIPKILTLLPNLRSLDTEYLASGPSSKLLAANPEEMAALRHLTVRTSSIDIMGPLKLWTWITTILPRPGLETLKLHAFTLHMGHTRIPRAFILELATLQADSLKHFIAGDAELILPDVECLCYKFPKLETLECLVVAPDVDTSTGYAPTSSRRQKDLSLEQAQNWMLRNESSLLRIIGINSVVYTGKWILEEQALKFEVVADVEGDKWNT